jgi:uncharacterized protein with HEPN domain
MVDANGRDAALLLDMLLSARDALTFIAGVDEAAFLKSRLHQNAVIRSLEVIGEAASKIASETKAAQPEIPWRQMIDMRNRLIHGYGEVRLDLVWAVAQARLGSLVSALEAILAETESDALPE